MRIQILSQPFSVCRAESLDAVDPATPYVFTARTDRELSLVCPTAAVPPNTLSREDGWRAFRIEGPLDFSLVGILARIASLLSREGISIFALSTYETDYVLTRAGQFDRAIAILLKNGYARDPEEA